MLDSFDRFYLFPLDFEESVPSLLSQVDYVLHKRGMAISKKELPYRYSSLYMNNLDSLLHHP